LFGIADKEIQSAINSFLSGGYRMDQGSFAQRIKNFVDEETIAASLCLQENDLATAFHHLERAHILGQSVTIEHTRVHWLMLKVGWRKKDFREIFGQLFRIVGAFTKTPLGIYPTGNTGGANVSPFKPMPIPKDLQEKLNAAKANS
jgi:hypothetical protein